MRSLLPILLTVVILAPAAAPAAPAAHREFELESVELTPERQIWPCIYGNRTSGSGYEGWWGGMESYARLIDPRVEPCDCDIGFSIRAIHIMLGLDASCDLQISARLLEVDDPWGCPTPGITLAWAPVIQVDDIDIFGYYEIEIPCDFPCASMDEPYFIAVDFYGGSADRVNLVGGGPAEDCVNWNDWGSGWVDLVGDIGFQSGLTIWADSDCCYQPIANTPSSWGAVKSLYR